MTSDKLSAEPFTPNKYHKYILDNLTIRAYGSIFNHIRNIANMSQLYLELSDNIFFLTLLHYWLMAHSLTVISDQEYPYPKYKLQAHPLYELKESGPLEFSQSAFLVIIMRHILSLP